jgi:tetratricopeptide (TPR) repeat protein
LNSVRNAFAAVLTFVILSTMSVPAQSTLGQLAQAGWQAVRNGDGENAAAAFAKALSMRPSDPVLNLGAGVAAHLQGRDGDAAGFLRKAVELDPALTPASALLGEIQYHEGDLDLAIRTYEAALVHKPDEPRLKERLNAWKDEATSYRSYRTLKDDRFAVMFDGPVERPLAEHATATLRREFWRIGKELGSYPSSPVNVIFYTDQQFKDVTGAPEWSKGQFDGQIRMPIRGALENLEQFDRVLTHELTHAMLRSIASRNVPAWLNEGLAMRFEGDEPKAAEHALSTARLFVPLSDLRISFTQLSRGEAAVAYAQSLFVTSALVDRIGTNGLSQLLHDLDRGQTVEEGVRRFGFTFEDFESSLAQRVGAKRAASP